MRFSRREILDKLRICAPVCHSCLHKQPSGLFAFSLFYEGHSGTSKATKTLDVLKLEEGQRGVNFSLKGTDEVVLLIEDPQSELQFKIALGAQENSVTYLSLLSKGK